VSMLSRLLGQSSVTADEGGHTFRAVIGIWPSRLSVFWYPSDWHALKVDQLDLIDSEAEETHLWSIVFLGNLY